MSETETGRIRARREWYALGGFYRYFLPNGTEVSNENGDTYWEGEMPAAPPAPAPPPVPETYDSLRFRCPSCGDEVEVKSKAGRCAFEDFTPEDATPPVAADMWQRSATCPCGAEIGFNVAVIVAPYVTGRT